MRANSVATRSAARLRSMRLMEETEGAVVLVQTASDINLSRISHANIVGFSRLYCSIFETTVGVATFGLEPPIRPGGRSEPAGGNKKN